jgi:transposase
VRLAEGSEVRMCYEAGPCGFGLKRQIETAGPVICEVIAPSMIPKRPGCRIKTDRRDAKNLAELFRAGLLREVQSPTEAEEAVRDLCRCREDVKECLMSARHRLSKWLLRRAVVFRSGSNWTRRHRSWLRGLRFEDAIEQAVLDEYLGMVEQLEERKASLDQRLEKVASGEPYCRPVGWLRCFYGIDTITAISLLAELYAFARFAQPRQLMSYLGLVPSEHSSGDDPRRGSITKAGNRHVRSLLVEAAWHYRHRPTVGYKLKKRREGQPASVVAIADKAHRRLNRRYRRLTERGKLSTVANVAVARELVGFIWDVLRPDAPHRTHL